MEEKQGKHSAQHTPLAIAFAIIICAPSLYGSFRDSNIWGVCGSVVMLFILYFITDVVLPDYYDALSKSQKPPRASVTWVRNHASAVIVVLGLLPYIVANAVEGASAWQLARDAVFVFALAAMLEILQWWSRLRSGKRARTFLEGHSASFTALFSVLMFSVIWGFRYHNPWVLCGGIVASVILALLAEIIQRKTRPYFKRIWGIETPDSTVPSAAGEPTTPPSREI